jgi:serine/threonine protein kinase
MFENSSDFSYRIENDMWSVGVIAFTLLSGMAPFDG